MKETQKYVAWIAVLAVVGAVFPFLRDVYLANVSWENLTYLDKKYWEMTTSLVLALQNIVAAIWLWVLARRDGLNRVIWTFFGLIFGLLAVGIFYLIRLNEKMET